MTLVADHMTFTTWGAPRSPYAIRAVITERLLSRGSVADDKFFRDLLLLELGTLLVSLIVSDIFGLSLPPLICTVLTGCYYLMLQVRFDKTRRAAIRRRLAARRDVILRRLFSAR